MIECTACHTFNPEASAACLACGFPLAAPAAKPVGQTGPMRCPAGHPIDPSWKSCPYCDRVQAAATAAADRGTRLEGAPRAAHLPTRLEEATAAGPGAGVPRFTRLEEDGAWASRQTADPRAAARSQPTRLETSPAAKPRVTVLADELVSPAPAPAHADRAGSAPPAQPSSGEERAASAGAASQGEGRRMVAVLAAPDLQPGGAVFAIRAGKNTLGADRASDICLAQDPNVSREHALLLYRGGSFRLADRMSTNGTWVNGEEVPANGAVELHDRDRLRCGSVELLLLVIDPPGGATAAAESAEGPR